MSLYFRETGSSSETGTSVRLMLSFGLFALKRKTSTLFPFSVVRLELHGCLFRGNAAFVVSCVLGLALVSYVMSLLSCLFSMWDFLRLLSVEVF